MLALSAFDIVLIALVALVAFLAIGGFLANAVRLRREDAEIRRLAEEADHHLAAAHAEDNGWRREALEEAARRAFAERHPGRSAEQLVLVQVIDREGTDRDEAVFHVRADDGSHTVRLLRSGDDWHAG